jgi:hypothetical protein
MSDVITQAHNARSQLGRALDVLQVENVPPSIQDVAEPVARAMSWLHRIETKGEKIDAANEALSALRTALNQLQEPNNVHPSADAALEVVAKALGMVHQLTQTLNEQHRQALLAPTPVAPIPIAPLGTVATPTPPPSTTKAEAHDSLPPVNPADAITVETYVRQQEPLADTVDTATVDTVTRPAVVIEDEDSPILLNRVSSPPAQTSALAAAAQDIVNPQTSPNETAEHGSPTTVEQPTAHAALPAHPLQPAHPSVPPLRPSNHPSVLPALNALPGELFVEAALGAYSTTNFYKSLNGNDVIEAGGLFIATYAPPDVEQAVRVHVSLPGGFEFQARGVVAWVREMPKTGSLNPLSPPGYGVRFTEISPEARQLVYRYVRNRDPLFYDDL